MNFFVKPLGFLSIFFALNMSLFIPIRADEVTRKKSKIAIISLYDNGYTSIGKYSDWNKKAYAKKHGYDLYLHHELLDFSRPPAWSKIPAIEEHLNDHEWIYWSDADSLIMNDTIKLESLIDNNYDLVITKEMAGWQSINTGSFLLRNCDWSRKLLKDIYNQPEFIHNVTWEQAAFMNLLKINPSLNARIKILHQKVMNSGPIGIYRPGDFVIHFYGPSSWLKEETGLDKSENMHKYYLLSLNFQLQKIMGMSENHLRKRFEKLTELENKFTDQWKQYYHVLVNLINKFKLKIGCEIGVGFGEHSETILKKTAVTKLFSIDAYKNYNEYDDVMNLSQDLLDILFYKVNQRLNVFDDRSELIRGLSKNVAREFNNNEMDFVFIDANHSFAYVLDDLESWYRKVRTEGIIAGYGYNKKTPDVVDALKKFFGSKNIKINQENDVWWIVKP